MGGSASITYSVPVTQKPEGESAVYRNPFTKDKLYACATPGLETMKSIIINSYEHHANKPALGISLSIQEG